MRESTRISLKHGFVVVVDHRPTSRGCRSASGIAGFVYVAVTRYPTPDLKLIGIGILTMFGALIVTAIASMHISC